MKNLIPLFYLFLSFNLAGQSSEFSKNSIIVSFNNSTTLRNLTELKNNTTLKNVLGDTKLISARPLDKSINKSSRLNNRPVVLKFNTSENISILLSRLESSGLFSHLEPDYINYGSGSDNWINNEGKELFPPGTGPTNTPNDPLFFRQWYLNNDGSFNLSPATPDADIDMPEAWDITTGNPNITIAVIDSGTRMSHPEFSGRFWINPDETINGLDDDNDSYVDDMNGWDFVNDDNDPTDDHGHGTNVSGILLATGNNGIGYAGVDWQCKFMPLKALNSNNSGQNSDIIEAFYYAISKGVKIISISIGGSGFSSFYETAVNAAYDEGIVVVACMMNFNNNVPYYPAAFENTIAVGSTDSNDHRTEPFFWSSTSGSNYGPHIDVVAPGNYMYGLSYNSDTNYNFYWGGTSQATPLVSGICSLLLSQNPQLSVDQIKEIIRESSEDQVGDALDTAGWDQYYGAGRVNAFNALQQSLSTTESELLSQLIVSPNPVKDILTFSGPDTSSMTSFSIFNIHGQSVNSGNLNGNELDFSKLVTGVYFLKVSLENKGTFVKKVIKL